MLSGESSVQQPGRISIGWRYAIAVVLAAGVILRLAAAGDAFWLDEIMSYVAVRERVSMPWDILTRCHSDNNHPLNSLVLYVLGEQPHWLAYRLPSLLAGAGAIVLGTRMLRRRGNTHGVIAALLLSFSYPLIVYSSEARGYGPLILFTVWALAIVDQRFGWTLSEESSTAPPSEPSRYEHRHAPLRFCIAVILGFLAHPTFIHVYGALAVWTIYRIEERTSSVKAVVLELIRWHLAPALFLLFYYDVFLSRLQISGGDPGWLIDVIGSAAALALGAPEHGALAQLALVVWAAGLVKGLQHVYQRDFGAFLFFLCAIVIMPALLILGQQLFTDSRVRYFPRYFMVSHIAYLLLAAYWLGDVFRGEALQKALCAAGIALFCAGNLNHTANFLRFGRGHYREALQYLAETTEGDTIRVCSNHDFRTTMILSYYNRYLPPDKELVYLSGDDRAKAEWCIIGASIPLRGAPKAVSAEDTRFVLKQYFPFYGLSGSCWCIYQRDASPLEGDPPATPTTQAEPDTTLAPGS